MVHSFLKRRRLRIDAALTASLFPSRNPTLGCVAPDGSRVFVKHAVRGDAGIDAERAALRALSGLPSVPRVVAEEAGVLALEWLEGRTLFALRRSKNRGFAHDVEIGRALAQLQRSDRPSFPQREVPGDFAQTVLWTSPELYASLGPATLPLVVKVQRHDAAMNTLWWLVKTPTARLVVHGDLRQPNVLINRKGHVTFLDWEASGVGDPARDVGMLLAEEFRSWFAPEVESERQTEAERNRHVRAVLTSWERTLGTEDESRRARVVAWLAEALLRHEFTRAHHRYEHLEAVVDFALELLADPRRWAASL